MVRPLLVTSLHGKNLETADNADFRRFSGQLVATGDDRGPRCPRRRLPRGAGRRRGVAATVMKKRRGRMNATPISGLSSSRVFLHRCRTRCVRRRPTSICGNLRNLRLPGDTGASCNDRWPMVLRCSNNRGAPRIRADRARGTRFSESTWCPSTRTVSA